MRKSKCFKLVHPSFEMDLSVPYICSYVILFWDIFFLAQYKYTKVLVYDIWQHSRLRVNEAIKCKKN